MDYWKEQREADKKRKEAIAGLEVGDIVWVSGRCYKPYTEEVSKLTKTLIVLKCGKRFKRTGHDIGQQHSSDHRYRIDVLTDQAEKYAIKAAQDRARFRTGSKLGEADRSIRNHRYRDTVDFDAVEKLADQILALLGVEVTS